MVCVDVLGLVKSVLDDIRLQDVIILLESEDSVPIYLVYLAVHHNRSEPVYHTLCDVYKRRLDDKALVCREDLPRYPELGLEMEIVSDHLKLGLVDDDRLLGHLSDHDGLAELDKLYGHVDIDDLTVIDSHFIVIVLRLVEKKLRIIWNECRVVSVYVCECYLVSVINYRYTAYRFRCGKVPYNSLDTNFVLCLSPEERHHHQHGNQKYTKPFHNYLTTS